MKYNEINSLNRGSRISTAKRELRVNVSSCTSGIEGSKAVKRSDIFPEERLPDAGELLGEGRALAQVWQVGPSAFLSQVGLACEAAFKRQEARHGRLMQHAQIGFRSLEKSINATRQIHEKVARTGGQVDRYGLCLDWSMGVPMKDRAGAVQGTGMILNGPEDFAALANAAPVAPHFGDFVLGFPAALENTCFALAAGATAIGNLGQYFTFRLPGSKDDIAATSATLSALGLIAAQDREILVHSNLDDGFAAVMSDVSCVFGVALLERHIAAKAGVEVSHCFGHHFTNPLQRLAFQRALARGTAVPGTQIYGATVLYQGEAAENYAAMAQYLQVDILGQALLPTGHALNPVPVSENRRIPDTDEIINAQLFLARAIDLGPVVAEFTDLVAVDRHADRIETGGQAFAARVLAGLADAGIDTENPFELLLSLRRLGGKRLERMFGGGKPEESLPNGRRALVPSPLAAELEELAIAALAEVPDAVIAALQLKPPRVLSATTDVHEHGKLALDIFLKRAGCDVVDGGVSVDPAEIVVQATGAGATAIALSTYNGIALSFARELKKEMSDQGLDLPVLIGGRLNQIPIASNTSLPQDVSVELSDLGLNPCATLTEAASALLIKAETADT